MKPASIGLKRADEVSKEVAVQKEKKLYDKYTSDVRHITWKIETAVADGRKYIVYPYDTLDKNLIKYLETMGYIVVYMKENDNYIIAFDKETTKEFIDYNNKYCFEDKCIRVIGLVAFLAMWSSMIFSTVPIELKLLFLIPAIWSSIVLIKIMRKGAKYKK